MRLLLIEDNQRLAELTAANLHSAGFAVDCVYTAEDGKEAAATGTYDVVVLDLGLPDADGLTVLADMRERRDATPVLILTARDGVDNRVKGLNQGSDDYLVKPFAMEELVARIRVLLRRPGRALGLSLMQGNLTFDTADRQVMVDGQLVELSRRELDALELLMRRAGRVVPKSAIENALYSLDDDIASNAVEVLIHRLRKRMQAAGATVHVHTLRGIGYLLSPTTAL
jgi:DNA-binding response OmpR family regulator